MELLGSGKEWDRVDSAVEPTSGKLKPVKVFHRVVYTEPLKKTISVLHV